MSFLRGVDAFFIGNLCWPPAPTPHPGRDVTIIQPMHALRHAHHLARLVLVWFVLSIGVAVASPLVSPQGMALICSGSGAMKVLVKTADGATEASSHSLDCPLCASIGAPPPVARTVAAPDPTLGYVFQPIPVVRIASLTAAPLPARGPPAC